MKRALLITMAALVSVASVLFSSWVLAALLIALVLSPVVLVLLVIAALVHHLAERRTARS